jgi:transposase
MISSEVLLGLPGYECSELGWVDGAVWIGVRRAERPVCPRCGGTRLRSKGWIRRRVRHEDWGRRRCYLELELRKWLCRECGRAFREPLPGIRPYQRSSEAFQRCVFQWHLDGVNRSRLGRREGLGAATVERYFQRGLKRQFGHWHPPRCPPVLGLDEHFFTRKKGYATTLCDLRRHKVYDVVLGRSEAALAAYWERLEGKREVRVVCMDLASVYRAIVRKHFPNAAIVADRFHVIRLINHHFLGCWRELDPAGSRNRGLVSLMRRHRHNLTPQQQLRLGGYLAERPVLELIYRFKQRLSYLLLKKSRTRRECAKLVPRLLKAIAQLRDCGLTQLVTLGETLYAWRAEIALMWRFTRNNGITEGFHTKMELINRQAYGFRNFQNYRMRVKVLCGESA